METYYCKSYSNSLNRDMEMKVYGHAGRPILFIPCQNGRFYDFENFHMAEVLFTQVRQALMEISMLLNTALILILILSLLELFLQLMQELLYVCIARALQALRQYLILHQHILLQHQVMSLEHTSFNL